MLFSFTLEAPDPETFQRKMIVKWCHKYGKFSFPWYSSQSLSEFIQFMVDITRTHASTPMRMYIYMSSNNRKRSFWIPKLEQSQ